MRPFRAHNRVAEKVNSIEVPVRLESAVGPVRQAGQPLWPSGDKRMSDIETALAQGLGESFGPHLAALCERTARALTACGFTGLLVHSGSALTVFEDDRTYPFVAHAPFKVWVPLSDAPDSFIWFHFFSSRTGSAQATTQL